MSIRIDDDGRGNIGLACEVSGLPLSRVTQDGMFCDGTPCKCEGESARSIAQVKRLMRELMSLQEPERSVP